MTWYSQLKYAVCSWKVVWMRLKSPTGVYFITNQQVFLQRPLQPVPVHTPSPPEPKTMESPGVLTSKLREHLWMFIPYIHSISLYIHIYIYVYIPWYHRFFEPILMWNRGVPRVSVDGNPQRSFGWCRKAFCKFCWLMIYLGICGNTIWGWVKTLVPSEPQNSW